MAILERLLGTHRDMPQIASCWTAGAAAAGSNDFEHTILSVPSLAQLPLSPGEAGTLPSNDLYIRSIQLIFEASVTGAATNNFALNFRQYRGGMLLTPINTGGPALTAGSDVVIAPTSMQGIQVGQILYISNGSGTAEYVTVSAITAGVSFTVPTLANNHSGAYTITSANLSTLYFQTSSVTAAAYTPMQCNSGAFTAILPNQLKAGDALTVQRQSFGTGLAAGSPAFTAVVEWVALYNNGPRG